MLLSVSGSVKKPLEVLFGLPLAGLQFKSPHPVGASALDIAELDLRRTPVVVQ